MKIKSKRFIEDSQQYCDLKIPGNHNYVLASGVVSHNCGTGVTAGLSKKAISFLPDLVNSEDKTGTVVLYSVEDTIEGWADSVEALLMCYFKNTPLTGRKIEFDYSKIRKKGSVLKTGGGKAPGHEGLKKAHKNIKKLLDYIIEEKSQARIKPVNVYDILMHCADAVLSGGIRRAATMAIFDYDDEEMMNSKVNFHVTKYGGFEKEGELYHGWVYTDGNFGGFKGHKYEVSLNQFEYDQVKERKEINWTHIEPQRARSNNSVLLLRDSCTPEQFNDIIEKTKQWGEPGFIFANDPWALFNPCAEIGFIPRTKDGRFGFHFCNLTTQNGAFITSLDEFLECTEGATIIGTLQAGYTDFFYLNSASKELADEEALLGVSITGMMDNPDILLNPRNQYLAAQLAVKINKEWAGILHINPAARATALKPEGTSSLALKCASGIHAHHAYDYFRRVQMNKLDPVYKFLKKLNPHACEESAWSANKTDDVVTFPISVPKHVMIKDDLTAIEHLNIIKDTYENWVMPGTTDRNERDVTHNVSCTVIVKDEEWSEVSKYIYDHRDSFAAVSFLSHLGDKMYKQAPLEKKLPEDEERWNNLISNWQHVDYTKLVEKEDKTELQQTAVCVGNACELPGIPG